MREHLDAPVARAVVTWRSAAEGGRRSGPPTAPVYAATCVFPLGDDAEVRPGWPTTAEPHLSVLLEAESSLADKRGLYAVDFLAPELARPFLHVGAPMLVMEGPRVVGEATFVEVNPHEPELRARLTALAAALAEEGRTSAAAEVTRAAASLAAGHVAVAADVLDALARVVGDSWPHTSVVGLEVLACAQEVRRRA